MKSKFIIIAVLTLITIGTSATAYAQPGWHHDEWRRHCYNINGPAFELTEEQRSTFNSLQKQHWSSVEPLTQQLIVKRAELRSQMIAQAPDTNKITALNREIGELKGKLAAEHIRFRNELEKQGVPVALAGCGANYRHGDGNFGRHGAHKRHMDGGWDCLNW